MSQDGVLRRSALRQDLTSTDFPEADLRSVSTRPIADLT
jgi:hypothetical protein